MEQGGDVEARRAQVLDLLGLRGWQLRSTPEADDRASREIRGAPGCASAAAETEPAPHAARETATGRTVPPAARTVAARETREAPDPGHEAPPARAERYDPPYDWAGLQAAVAACRRCRLCETRHQTVFGVGPEHAELMVVGEGPGAEEDARGEPFIGRAGKLLDQMLAAIGCSREHNVFITNVVKCRPPNNRDPMPDEVAACRPYLERQIELVGPRLIVGLGRVAAQRLLDTDQPLGRLRGRLHHYGARQTPVMLTYHPAYLLRTPREKAKAWQDLKVVARFLAQERAP